MLPNYFFIPRTDCHMKIHLNHVGVLICVLPVTYLWTMLDRLLEAVSII